MPVRITDHPVAGTGHAITVCRIAGARPGPVLALTGGIHGDEAEGPLVLSELIRSLDPGRLAGTLLSGWVYQVYGLAACLWISAALVAASALMALALPQEARLDGSY